MRNKLFIFIVLLALVGAGLLVWRQDEAEAPANTTPKPQTSQPNVNSSAFNKTRLSTTDPTSIWVIANKQHPLQPKEYVPNDLVFPAVPLRVPGNESMQLRREAATALESMVQAANTENIHLMLSSGYRSYAYQVNLYNGYVASIGQDAADKQSARPGFSEHQTGLAADVEPTSKICEVEACFADTPEGKWTAANAYKYGYIVRYNPGDEDISGYEAEPWHIRYIGVELATELHRLNISTLEKFFDVTGGKSYVQ